MNSDQAKEIIRELAKQGCIIISDHCRTRMQERNVTTDDRLYVLMWGNIDKIKKNTKYNNWKLEVEGRDLNDDQLTVQATVNEDERTIVITVY